MANTEMNVKTTVELLGELTAKRAEVNAAYADGDIGAATTGMEALKTLLSVYNEQSMREAMRVLRATANPMEAAIRELEYKTLSVKSSKGKTGVVNVELENSFAYYSLAKLEEFCSRNIGHEAGWYYALEKFNYLIALRVAKELDIDPKVIKGRYKIDAMALGVDLGATPTSNTKMLEQLQKVVDKILFVPREDGTNSLRVTSHDVRFLIGCLTRAGRNAHQMVFSRPETALNLIMRIINRVLTGGHYDLEVPMEKNKKGNLNASIQASDAGNSDPDDDASNTVESPDGEETETATLA